jgi:hypothetical protein
MMVIVVVSRYDGSCGNGDGGCGNGDGDRGSK